MDAKGLKGRTKLLDSPVSSLPLCVRTRNKIIRSGIKTVGDLFVLRADIPSELLNSPEVESAMEMFVMAYKYMMQNKGK